MSYDGETVGNNENRRISREASLVWLFGKGCAYGNSCPSEKFYDKIADQFWKSAVSSCARAIVELELRDHSG